MGSYYAASVNEHTDYPPLTGSVSADVCVIGAGFTGISTALHLAERGYNVHVVEANKVGWGASGRNGGQMIGGIAGEKAILRHHGPGIARLLWDMRWAGHEIIRQCVNKYQIQCDLKSGYLDVAIKERHVRDQYEEYDLLEQNNLPHEYQILWQEQTRDLIGTDAIIGNCSRWEKIIHTIFRKWASITCSTPGSWNTGTRCCRGVFQECNTIMSSVTSRPRSDESSSTANCPGKTTA